jgi:hypothetical protein
MLKVFPTSTPPANFEPLELCLAAGESQSFQLAARPAPTARRALHATTGNQRVRAAPPPTCAALNDTDFDCHGKLGNVTRFPIWCNDLAQIPTTGPGPCCTLCTQNASAGGIHRVDPKFAYMLTQQFD